MVVRKTGRKKKKIRLLQILKYQNHDKSTDNVYPYILILSL